MFSIVEDRFNAIMEEGLGFFEMGKYDDCIETLSEAIGYARLLKRENYLPKLMIKRADSYYHKGDYRGALKHCQRLVQYIDQLDVEDMIDFYEIQAISLAQIGSYEEAISMYNQMINIPQARAQIKAFAGLGLVYYHQAKFANLAHRYDTALFYYEKALKQLDIDRRNMTMILHNMGMVYYEQGYYEKALSRYLDALKYHVEEYYPYTFNELAKVYIRLNELEKANEYIDKAAILLTQVEEKSHVEIGRNFFVKALYYRALKDYDTAIFFFKLALNEVKEREVYAEIGEIYYELATIYKDIDPELSIDYMAESRYYLKFIR